VKTGEMRKAMVPATSRAPNTARRPSVPPSAVPTARMVDTAANEVPWTIGCRAPIFHTPIVCRIVASPEMNNPAETR